MKYNIIIVQILINLTVHCANGILPGYGKSPYVFDESFPIINLTDYKSIFEDKLTVEHIHHNEYAIPLTFQQLKFSCFSTKPNKWIYSRTENFEQVLKDVRIQKWKNGPGEYVSEISLTFKTPKHFPYFGCEIVGKKSKVSWIVSTSSPKNQSLIVSFQTGLKIIKAVEKKQFGYDKNCQLKLIVDLRRKAFSCVDIYTNEILSPWPIECANQDDCESYYNKNGNGTLSCPRNVEFQNCLNCSTLTLFRTSVFVCKTATASMAKTIFYSSLPKRIGGTEIMTEDNMLSSAFSSFHVQCNTEYTGAKNEKIFFRGQRVQCNCMGLSSLFTFGFRWTIFYKNGKRLRLSGERDTESYDNDKSPIIMNTIWIMLENNMDNITCIAPLWNSEKNRSKAQKLHVLDPIAPGPITTTERVENGQPIFKCTASGYPLKFKWFRNNMTEEMSIRQNSQSYKIQNGTETTGQQWTELIVTKRRGPGLTFYCQAFNWKGETFAEFITNTNPTSGNFSSLTLPEPEATSQDGKTIYAVAMGIGIPLVCLLTLLLVFAFYKIRQQKRELEVVTDEDIQNFDKGHGELNSPLASPYNLGLYEIPRWKFTIGTSLLGKGHFSCVYKGQLEASAVAVKVVSSKDRTCFLALMDEIKLHCYVGRHINILSMVGASTRNLNKRDLHVVFDYCAKGNMLEFLRSSSRDYYDYFATLPNPRHSNRSSWMDCKNAGKNSLCSQDLVRWAYEISSAMNHLNKKNIVHGNLTARSVLIGERNNVKLSNFGLIKQHRDPGFYQQTEKTFLRWCALETFEKLDFTLQSDIWSYGVTLWEMFTLGRVPYEAHFQIDLPFSDLLKNGLRLDRPKYSTQSIFDVMKLCWSACPSQRPSFLSLMGYFETELKDMFAPPNTSSGEAENQQSSSLASTKHKSLQMDLLNVPSDFYINYAT